MPEIADRIMNKLLKDRDFATETRIKEVEAAAFADWMNIRNKGKT